ncbi:hypothetical protein SAMN05660489_06420, partial [Pseudomonas sp. LAMO17WK12:I10]
MPLRQQAEVKPFSDENDQASRQPRIRSKRSLPPAPSNNVREDVPAPSRQWHHNIPAASLQSEHFDVDRGIRYEAEPVSDAMPLRPQTEVEPFSDKNDQASGQPRIRRTRALPSDTTVQAAAITGNRASYGYRRINNDINFQVKLAGLSDDVIIKNIQERANQARKVRSLLANGEYDKAKAVLEFKVFERLSVLAQRYSLRKAEKYRSLLNGIWKALGESRRQSPEIKTLVDNMKRAFLPERSVPQPSEGDATTTPLEEDTEQQTTDAVNALKSVEALNAPIMNMGQFIDDHIKTAIEQYNRDPKQYDPNGRMWGGKWKSVDARRFPGLTPDTLIRVDFASRGTPGKD